MAKKKTGADKVPATAMKNPTRHARIELPDHDYRRLKTAAERVHISIAAYIRQAVMERIEDDEHRSRGK
jgi:predicted DNA-binding protein